MLCAKRRRTFFVGNIMPIESPDKSQTLTLNIFLRALFGISLIFVRAFVFLSRSIFLE